MRAFHVRLHRYADFRLYSYVIANDLSETACEAMRRNVELNGLGPKEEAVEIAEGPVFKKIPPKVRVNEGDAW